MKRTFGNLLFAVCLAAAAAGCGRVHSERVEWTTMGTVAALQARVSSGADAGFRAAVAKVKTVCGETERLFNAYDPASELSRLAPMSETEILSACDPAARLCYEAAFEMAAATGGAFNPRWRGPGTLDLGAIAKGGAVDRAAAEIADISADALVDIGGNVKSVRGTWRTGVKSPSGTGFAAVVELHEGEALATSATYYRGSHIYDGRTGKPVANGVASVTVLCRSAMLADALSTALFALGPGEGRRLLEECFGAAGVSVLWIFDDGRVEVHPTSASARFRSP